MSKSIVLDDTGWIQKRRFDRTIYWYRRVGFISMHCYRSQGGPHHRFEAFINAEPFGTIRKEFKSQASPKRFCEEILNSAFQKLKDLNQPNSSIV